MHLHYQVGAQLLLLRWLLIVAGTGVTNTLWVAALGRLVAWGVDGARSSCLQELKRAAQDALVHQAHLGLAGSLFDRGGGGA